MAFDDHVEIVSVEGHVRMRLRTMDRAVRHFSRARRVTARVMWVTQQAAASAA